MTSAGKTHTVIGTKTDRGILYLSVEKILANCDEFSVNVIEIYNEDLYDLNAKERVRLLIKEREKKFVLPSNCLKRHIHG